MIDAAKLRAAKKILSGNFVLQGGEEVARSLAYILNSLDELIISYEKHER